MAVTLLVGEAPSRRGSPGFPLAGAMERWAAILSVDATAFELLEPVNLLGRWPGKAGKGSAFPIAAASRAGKRLRREANGRKAMFVGRRVARAMGCGDLPILKWFPDPGNPAFASVAIVPHPSGVNRQYNDPKLARRAARFVLEAAEEVGHGRKQDE